MKRYTRIKDRDVKLADNGELVTYADYLSLQSALRDALNEAALPTRDGWKIIAALRAQFLDDK